MRAPGALTRTAPCGTPSAYRWHLRWGQYPCGLCSEAHRKDKNAYRVRNGMVQSVMVPVELLGLLASTADPVTRQRLDEALGGAVVTACLAIARGTA